MSVDRWSWAWASEWGKVQMLEDAMDARAAAAASRSSELRGQLRNLKGDLSARIDTLAAAFAAYVELDTVREQLAAFPQHSQARRLAGDDVELLLAGRQPEQRADVPSYWLVPAVNALRPDGTVDADLVAQARERDELSARRFLLTVQAALGRGPELIDELVALMAPEDRDGVPTWDEVQVIWWASVLRGAFGPDALAALRPVAAPALAGLTGEDWLDWAEQMQSDAKVRSFGRVQRSEAQSLRWLGDQLAAATEPVGQTSDDQSWRMSWQAPPSGEAAAPTSTDDPEAARRSTVEMLVGLANHQIARGSAEEQQLLARAAELRSELANPSHTGEPAAQRPAGGLPIRPAAVADEVRATAADQNASLADRRELLRWLEPSLRSWLTGIIEAPPPMATVLPAQSSHSLLVDANGVVNRGDLDRAQLELAHHHAPSGLAAYGVPMLGAGAGVLVLAIVAAVVTGQGWWWLAALVGAAITGFGVRQWTKRRAARTDLEVAQHLLDSRIKEVQATASRTDASNLGRQRDLVEAAQRALNMLPE